MTLTYVAISTVTVGSGGSAFMSFTSIPATYTDLIIKASIRNTGGGDYTDQVRIKVNGVSATDASFSNTVLRDLAGTVGTYTQTASQLGMATGPTATANVFGSLDAFIPNYAGATQKTISTDAVSENDSSSAAETLSAVANTTTSAITSLDLLSISGNCLEFSTATLYGIKSS